MWKGLDPRFFSKSGILIYSQKIENCYTCRDILDALPLLGVTYPRSLVSSLPYTEAANASTRIPMANQGYLLGVGEWESGGVGAEKTSPNYDSNPQLLA